MPNPSSLDQSRLLAMREMRNKYGMERTARHFGIKLSTLGRHLRELKRREKPIPRNAVGRVLVLDIETAPLTAYSWGVGKVYLSHDNIIEEPFILTWAAKWLFDSNVMGDACTPDEARGGDDFRVVSSIWSLIDEADVVIAHNGNRFDIPWLNTRFILHGIKPPRSYQSIDTLAVVKKPLTGFRFPSNRLDYLGKLIRDKGKIETNFNLWKRCKDGEPEALTEMLTYNKEDVVMLEEVYLFLRPWIKSHPNMGLYVEGNGEVCPNCGAGRLDWNGYYDTPAGRFSSFRCVECGAIGRSRYTALTFGKRKGLTVSTAR